MTDAIDDGNGETIEESFAYDPETCITAAELRANGFPIPDTIPDCGWVRRSSIEIIEHDVQEADDDAFHIDLKFQFMEPFRWISINAKLKKTDEDDDDYIDAEYDEQ